MKVKICCIQNIEEATLAIDTGADALGLVGPMPSGPGIISDTQIRNIIDVVGPSAQTFLLTSETKAKRIARHYQRTRPSTLQLVDTIKPEHLVQVRNELPAVKLVQVIHVQSSADIEHALRISEYVDMLLLDSGQPNLPVKKLGGTGNTHDWSISRQIVAEVDIPVYLAGGLNPDNILEAIETVKPYGIDVCSGVRTHGQLDPQKLGLFFDRIRKMAKVGA